MPAFVHDRAKRIMKSTVPEYGKDKGKQVAWAVSTQQGHATHKTPKTWHGKPFGTAEGRHDAKTKYRHPSTMKKTAVDHIMASVDLYLKHADGEPTIDQVAEFFKRNPNPSDDAFHQWAEGRGWQPNDAETVAYTLATEKAEFNEGGKANAEGKTPADVDQEQLAKGVIVEREHTPNIEDRKRIATDHLSENDRYYDDPMFAGDLKKESTIHIESLIPGALGVLRG